LYTAWVRSFDTSAQSVEITRLLRAWSGGDSGAFERLAPAIYAELRRIARGYMSHERPGQTLQATALVHEAYLRLVDLQSVQWQDRAHFFAVSAQMMRRILVDRARARVSGKRGGPGPRLQLDAALEVPEVGSWRASELMTLDDALTRMAEMDARKAKVIELRFFGGLSVEETAEVLKISPQSVMRDWKLAKAWLQRELAGSRRSDSA
jgi:RNA polymerase sigma factor (TIGR02999 family)